MPAVVLRELAIRALTMPLNLLPAAATAAVGLDFGLWPLFTAAPVVYLIMAGTTFWSAEEARRGTPPLADPPSSLDLSVNVRGCRTVTSDRIGWFSGRRRADS